MTANEIRKRFLEFFQAQGHRIVKSASLVPEDDPTLLFTGAGMNQFKRQFMGEVADFRRAATCQKCLRSTDLERVGRTSGHHTFFEMLGNFSFGDYFKEEAITWAWEFMTKELNLKEAKLHVSVYKDDKEAYDIWHNKIGLASNKIEPLGDEENFWPASAKEKGPNGPCGPCSEIFFDGDGESVEVWNLVFTQFERRDGGTMVDLPARNIDTGMGLERISAVMQGVRSNFETDLFVPIVREIKERVASLADGQVPSIYAIADHIRAATFAICDGVMPSNEGRGYVVRMLLRRAMRLARNPGSHEPFLYKLVVLVAQTMQEPYPELTERREDIAQVVFAEERKFSETLERGMALVENHNGHFGADFLFKMYDTFGFPIEIMETLALERGVQIDKSGFSELMQRQRQASRQASQMCGEIFVSPTDDKDKPKKVSRNHTATHLLHSALRKVLGEHALQKGSLVDSEYLRFDFAHFEPLTDDQIAQVEEVVKANIANNEEVKKTETTLAEAKRQGAIALFTEKYGARVRVVTIGDYSKEVCGGTHLDRTGQIGSFKIKSESGVASGVRRIVALTGEEAEKYIKGQEAYREREQKRKEALQKEKEEEAELLNRFTRGEAIGELVKGAVEKDGTKIVKAHLLGAGPNVLRAVIDKLRARLSGAIYILGNEDIVIIGLSTDLVKGNISAAGIVKALCEKFGGKGGGSNALAQISGVKIDEAYQVVQQGIIEARKSR